VIEREREIENILFTQVQYKVFTCPGQFEHRAPDQPLYSLSSLILREEELPRAFLAGNKDTLALNFRASASKVLTDANRGNQQGRRSIIIYTF